MERERVVLHGGPGEGGDPAGAGKSCQQSQSLGHTTGSWRGEMIGRR